HAPRPRAKGSAATAAAVAFEAEENYQPQIAEPVRPEAPHVPAPAAQARPAARASAPPAAEAKPLTESQKARQAAERLVVLPAVKIETTAELPKDGMDASSAATVSTPAPTPSAPEAIPAARADAPTQPAATTTVAAETGPVVPPTLKARRVVAGSSSRVLTERREAEITDAANSVPVVETISVSDRAPAGRRSVAGAIDLMLAALCSLPCAAVIELTSGRWDDLRVLASMGGIVLLVTFLYFVVSTGLFGRTPGMSLLSLRAVDARNALVPTTGQSMRRAFFYMLSLATFGLGLLYAFFDAEGRTAHDHLSGTIVVKE
ncbi:MAG TPA: RDD family protein, partial [Pyrinomonadaceae bacterium]|nr:RDD family protein [Pyrinomonadaceae bacterium]